MVTYQHGWVLSPHRIIHCDGSSMHSMYIYGGRINKCRNGGRGSMKSHKKYVTDNNQQRKVGRLRRRLPKRLELWGRIGCEAVASVSVLPCLALRPYHRNLISSSSLLGDICEAHEPTALIVQTQTESTETSDSSHFFMALQSIGWPPSCQCSKPAAR